MKKFQISRYGAYAIIMKDNHLLLTRKISGPYLGLWDLPGGGIEFNESPEEALRREIHEETALSTGRIELLTVLTHCGEYNKEDPYHFHHIGILYRGHDTQPIPNAIPEDELKWTPIKEISPAQLTPFAKRAFQVYI